MAASPRAPRPQGGRLLPPNVGPYKMLQTFVCFVGLRNAALALLTHPCLPLAAKVCELRSARVLPQIPLPDRLVAVPLHVSIVHTASKLLAKTEVTLRQLFGTAGPPRA